MEVRKAAGEYGTAKVEATAATWERAGPMRH